MNSPTQVRAAPPQFTLLAKSASSSYATRIGSILLIDAKDDAFGNELWRTDGTADGTIMIRDINSGPDASFPRFLQSTGKKAFFSANDGNRGESLWETDGTASGTRLVFNFPTARGLNVEFGSSVILNSTLFFFVTLSDGEDMTETQLWRSNGTKLGTKIVDADVDPDQLVELNDSVVYLKFGVDRIPQMWKTNGTPTGTVLIKKFYTEVERLKYECTREDNKKYLLGERPDCGVKNPQFQTFNWVQGMLPVLGNTLFFTADDGPHGQELWKTDGTADGTVMVKDIVPGRPSSSITSFSPLGNYMLMTVKEPTYGVELWRSDGTAAGTEIVRDIALGTLDSFPGDRVTGGNYAYFPAEDGNSGIELWRTDGTESGTNLVKDIRLGPKDSEPSVQSVNGTIYLGANDGEHGRELWTTDGTSAGTILVKDFIAGPRDGYMGILTPGISPDPTLLMASDGKEESSLWKMEQPSLPTPSVLISNASSPDAAEIVAVIPGIKVRWVTTGGCKILDGTLITPPNATTCTITAIQNVPKAIMVSGKRVTKTVRSVRKVKVTVAS